MAKRRMISAELMRSDAFLELPPESQLLYVHLLVEADDDGFIRGKKYVLAMLGLTEDAFTALSRAGFLIVFATGSAAIAHWPLMNKVPKDRYTPTRCRAEMARLEAVEGVGYVLREENAPQPAEPTVSVTTTEPLTDAVSPDNSIKTTALAGRIQEERYTAPAAPISEKRYTESAAPSPEKRYTEPAAPFKENKYPCSAAQPPIEVAVRAVEQTRETGASGNTPPSLPLSGGQSYAIPEIKSAEWQRLYPNVDVLSELRAMRGWLLLRPEKQRTAPETERFIHYWLSNAMRRAAQAPPYANPGELRRSRWADDGPPSYDMDRAMEKMMTTVPKLKKKQK